MAGSAAEAFFRQEYKHVVAFLRIAGASHEQAEDSTQNAMVELLRHWAEIRNAAGWVRRVALNDFRDTIRRDALAVIKALRAGELAVSHFDTPEANVDSRESREVRALLSQLPPAQQKTVALWMAGLSPHEIAQALNVSEATARSNMRHARQALRPRLGARG